MSVPNTPRVRSHTHPLNNHDADEIELPEGCFAEDVEMDMSLHLQPKSLTNGFENGPLATVEAIRVQGQISNGSSSKPTSSARNDSDSAGFNCCGSADLDEKFGRKFSLGERVADRVSAAVGSWTFVVTQSICLAAWILFNSLSSYGPDQFPFILLNLMLSFQAAYTAPIIMMSQNRQSDIDREKAFDLHEKVDHIRLNQVWALWDLVQLQSKKIDNIAERFDKIAEQMSNSQPQQGGHRPSTPGSIRCFKVEMGEEIRRFPIEEGQSPSIATLTQQLSSAYGYREVNVKYVDEEDEKVSIITDADLREAMKFAASRGKFSLRLLVTNAVSAIATVTAPSTPSISRMPLTRTDSHPTLSNGTTNVTVFHTEISSASSTSSSSTSFSTETAANNPTGTGANSAASSGSSSTQPAQSSPAHTLTAIVPCNNLDVSEAFYNHLGFTRPASDRPASGEDDGYRMLSDGKGGAIHLQKAVDGWLTPGKNPFGLYFYTQEVDRLANEFRGRTVEANGAEEKPWGMYEFSLSDPDSTLVRIGWPTRLRNNKQ